MKPTCHYDDARGWLSREHLRDCEGDCPGCKPCPTDHCGIRGCAHHVDHDARIWTCPRCIGRVRNDLAVIVRLYRQELPEQAEATGVNSEAANLIGPAALREDHEGARGWCSWPASDQRHPYAVLGRLDMALREDYGPRTSLAVTVERAAAYLTDLLAGTFPHEDQFEDTAAEIALLRAHMETAAGDSRKPEQGAPCPTCAADIEAQQAATATETAPGAPNSADMGPNANDVILGRQRARKAPRLRKRYADGVDAPTVAGDRDTWHCPENPAHWWSDADYRLRVGTTYLEHALALTTDELHAQYGVKPGTVRKWACETGANGRPKVRKRGYDGQGRQRYDVGDVREQMTRRDKEAV